MNKYKNLAFNTVIFAVGSFGSKIFSLLLNNLYTKHISPSEFYIKNLLEATALFLLPVFTFSLTEAVIRFGLDKKYDPKQVFTTSAVLTAGGMLLMAMTVPFLRYIPFLADIGGYTLLLLLYIAASSLRSLCSCFVQSRSRVKLVAADGILTTLMLFAFSVVFISHLGMGARGFMIASVLSDTCSSVFLFITGRLWRYFGIDSFDMPLGKSMLRFTAPLIPTIMMWSITELSDQIFIGNIHSEESAGLYAAAAKLPNLLAMLSTIFFKAWNMSAITENESADRNSFYERVYAAYEAALFIGSAGLILFIKPVSAVLINYTTFPEYRTVSVYAPVLIAAAVFNCLNQFLFGIYTATKHTTNAFVTSGITCAANLLMNACLIPPFGIHGAAAATFLSYILCYIVRMIDARRYVPFGFDIRRTIAGTAAVLAMSLMIIFDIRGCFVWLTLLTAALIAVNFKSLMLTLKKLK